MVDKRYHVVVIVKDGEALSVMVKLSVIKGKRTLPREYLNGEGQAAGGGQKADREHSDYHPLN